MSDAFFHKGLTIECDERVPWLRIEGHRILIEKHSRQYRLQYDREVRAPSLVKLAHVVIDAAPEFKDRARLRRQHLDILNQGRNVWNDWRRRKSLIRPVLYRAKLGTDIRSRDLREFDFSWAGLSHAKLRGANLTGANFFQAHLARTDFTGAILSHAHFCRADLYETNLTRAHLVEANLQGAQLAKTILSGAHLIRCAVYGMSVWDVKLDGAEQKDFIIRYRHGAGRMQSGLGTESEIRVDDLQIAQYVYLMLDNPKIRVVLEGGKNRSVLILGRFTKTRKRVLDAIRDKLRTQGYAPVIFDFDVPDDRTDLIQTIKRLAGLSRFIIGDITDPSSIPLELLAILSTYTIPIVPIIHAPRKPFSMMPALQDLYAPCVLDVHRYPSKAVLIARLNTIIRAALQAESRIADRLTEQHKIVELTG